MKEIRAYQTSDGSLFTEQSNAIARQEAIDIQAKLYEFWNEECSYGEIHMSEIVSVSYENREELISILLNKDLPPNRNDLMPKLAETEDAEQDDDHEDIFGL